MEKENVLAFEINNGDILHMRQAGFDAPVKITSPGGNVVIPAGEMVMLLNLYRYIKENDIQNDFINPHGANKEGAQVPADQTPEPGTKWQLQCMNAFVDGMIINDFASDEEAIQYAANYEARCIRITPDGKRALIYDPADDEI